MTTVFLCFAGVIGLPLLTTAVCETVEHFGKRK